MCFDLCEFFGFEEVVFENFVLIDRLENILRSGRVFENLYGFLGLGNYCFFFRDLRFRETKEYIYLKLYSNLVGDERVKFGFFNF